MLRLFISEPRFKGLLTQDSYLTPPLKWSQLPLPSVLTAPTHTTTSLHQQLQATLLFSILIRQMSLEYLLIQNPKITF
jgi:hypothetical protein